LCLRGGHGGGHLEDSSVVSHFNTNLKSSLKELDVSVYKNLFFHHFWKHAENLKWGHSFHK
jgi:hypothetical protein